MSDIFKALEQAPADSQHDLVPVLESIGFNDDGLIPAIAQQHDSGEVLMMAWMNREALMETLRTGRVCYWSRSRGKLWRKGESSGQQQHLRGAALDCDGDTLLLQVNQTGPACHSGRRSCFYVALEKESARITTAPLIDPTALYGKP
ncbi:MULTISPECIES: phosphoribosyl-AMP cyclohydrolase [Halomonas]|uniref:Phosphoribosyl-AMP cyclohydrolase n=2 Tax=Halomonas TaxID=2745 RepID=A0A7X4VXK1_9GAMM|nr:MULTISPECIES: phosphoribosyl-AMP cyclohydrolase [Halomonas]MDR5902101.1 phosphoribosyl-AMP cyclohydrolase [Halomonas icarae]NAW12199.1 phosphoribosyl-AMP cyclohydrolase [Halomonas icarae]TDB05508.1 phosphoribosyl-AMP cyclohydrolase [Halomonas marinisediminis]